MGIILSLVATIVGHEPDRNSAHVTDMFWNRYRDLFRLAMIYAVLLGWVLGTGCFIVWLILK